ncbi:collagen binding domain-containing protein [Bacillus sp. REN10]|uniref:collagen binding domain-containing protein n=1 Tax=Bacillus sp. REN10 TaxID=2782541 RepID=UPI00193B2E15|nr:collagen binding domain-containing protein [Bacillus sp. REN10]
MITVIFFCLFMIINSYASVAYAQTVNVVDSIRLLDSNGQEKVSFNEYEDVKIEVQWSAKSPVQGGDQFILEIPKELRGYSGSFPMAGPDGNSYGQCVGNGALLTCTYDDFVNGKVNVKGSLFIASQIKEIQEETTVVKELEFKVNGRSEFVSLSVAGHQSGAPTEVVDELLRKDGIIYEDSSDQVNWIVRVNQNKMPLGQVVLKDTVKGGHQFIKGSINLIKVNTDSYGNIISQEDVNPSQYPYRLIETESGFELFLGNLFGETFMVYYQTKILDPSQAFFENEATLLSWNNKPIIVSSQAKNYNAGGNIQGENGQPPVTEENVTVPPEQPPVTEENVTVPPEQPPVTEENVTVPPEQLPVTEENVTVPPEQPPVTEENATVPPEQPPVTEGNATVPPEQPPVTEGNATVPPEQPPVTEENVTVPPEQPPVTEENATVPPEQPPVTEENVTVPPEQPPVTEENVTVPPEQPPVTEENVTVPPKQPPVTEENVTVPPNQPPVTEENVTVPPKQPPVTEENATVPPEQPPKQPPVTEENVTVPPEQPPVTEESGTVPPEQPPVTEENVTVPPVQLPVPEENPTGSEENTNTIPEKQPISSQTPPVKKPDSLQPVLTSLPALPRSNKEVLVKNDTLPKTGDSGMTPSLIGSILILLAIRLKL